MSVNASTVPGGPRPRSTPIRALRTLLAWTALVVVPGSCARVAGPAGAPGPDAQSPAAAAGTPDSATASPDSARVVEAPPEDSTMAATPVPSPDSTTPLPTSTAPDSAARADGIVDVRALGVDTTAVIDMEVRLPPDTVTLDPATEEDAWVELTLAGMTLREKAGQLMMPMVLGGYAPVGSPEYRRIQRAIVRDGIGGLIVSAGSPTEVAAKLNTYQNMAQVPLLVGADLETGAGFRFDGTIHVPGATYLGGATTFPSLMAIAATGEARYAFEAGRVTGLEAMALGVHVPFAPVLDVNNNADNPIINVRSFGEDPLQVAEFGRRFVEGLQSTGAVATGKHFPGHGNTETDSHLDLPVIPLTRLQLDSVELVPFRAAIDEGIGAIMSAHVALPQITEGPGVPSTLSRNVLTGLLREHLGFDGLVITDAMDMYAIDRRFSRGEAAVRAVEAGADIVLMPPDVTAAIEGVVDAVADGRIPRARLDGSVRRVLAAKARAGLHRTRQTEIRDLQRTVGVPEHLSLSNEIAERSITLLRNQGSLIPLRGSPNGRVLSVSYRRTSDLLAGRAFNRRLRDTYRRLRTETVFRDTDARDYEELRDRARGMDLVIVSVYVTAVPQGGDPAVPERFSGFIDDLREDGVPHIVISFGNPYLLRDFPGARAYMLAWSGADASQRAAARALFGEIEIQGRTPTRIPPFFEIGDGIRVARKGR